MKAKYYILYDSYRPYMEGVPETIELELESPINVLSITKAIDDFYLEGYGHKECSKVLAWSKIEE